MTNFVGRAPGAHFGMATVSTDTGHNSTTYDASWADQNPETKADWGWRSMHGAVTLGKQLTRAYYGANSITRSYYSGCSTGGRQGLKEVQLYPDSFDGVLIGAPSWWVSRLNNWITKVGMYNLPVDARHHIPLSVTPVIAAEVVRQCDPQDGVVDGIVSSPETCNFVFLKLLCGPISDGKGCLNEAQIQTAKNVYSDYYSSIDGQFLYPGMTLSSESMWDVLLAGPDPSPFGLLWEQNFLFNNATWDWHQYNDSICTESDRLDPGNANAADLGALKAFKARGGKMILYHGLADGLVPVKGSQYLYNQVISEFGGNLGTVRDFFRMFLVPGMQHCWLTAVGAPWNFGGATQAGAMGMSEWSVPGFRDSRHDAFLALMDWVEEGKPVDEVIATSWHSIMNVTSGVWRQRPLCPWPEKAVYSGAGEVNAAGSWSCSAS